MEKTAFDYYSEGVLDALQNLNVSETTKVAALNHVKEAGMIGNLLDRADLAQRGFTGSAKSQIGQKALDLILGKGRTRGLRAANRLGTNRQRVNLNHPKAQEALEAAQKRALIGLGATGAGTLGLGGLGAAALMSDDEPEPGFFESLSPAEQAALIAGGTAGVGGLAYGASQLL